MRTPARWAVPATATDTEAVVFTAATAPDTGVCPPNTAGDANPSRLGVRAGFWPSAKVRP